MSMCVLVDSDFFVTCFIVLAAPPLFFLLCCSFRFHCCFEDVSEYCCPQCWCSCRFVTAYSFPVLCYGIFISVILSTLLFFIFAASLHQFTFPPLSCHLWVCIKNMNSSFHFFLSFFYLSYLLFTTCHHLHITSPSLSCSTVTSSFTLPHHHHCFTTPAEA